MTTLLPNPKVDFYFDKASKWQAEMEQLRIIALECGLTEELKWGCPCYMLEKSNVVIIHGFKEYCGLLFFKGVLLKDPQGILIQQTENVQGARQARFSSVQQVMELAPALKAYLQEAIAVEKSGLKVTLKKTEDFSMPEELQQKLAEIPALKTAFEALTPGRQRAYKLYFAAPKQAKTREARVEKSMQQIFEGKGLND